MIAKEFVSLVSGSKWAIDLFRFSPNKFETVEIAHRQTHFLLSEYIVRLNPEHNLGFYRWDSDSYEIYGYAPVTVEEFFFFMVSLGSFIFDERTEMTFLFDWMDRHCKNYAELTEHWVKFKQRLLTDFKDLLCTS